MSETTVAVCEDKHKGGCKGQVGFYLHPFDYNARTRTLCEKHSQEWTEFLHETNRKYGVWSDCAPEGFDPTYAGESWEED